MFSLNTKKTELPRNAHQEVTLEKALEVAIGHEIRAHRRKKEITMVELAEKTGIPVSMLVKFESGETCPSLPSMQNIARYLGIPLTSMFRSYEDYRSAVHTKANEGIKTERRNSIKGIEYSLLGHLQDNMAGVSSEPFLCRITEETESLPLFQHAGVETLYILEGEFDYRHGDDIYNLKAGDTLLFDADTPHGPYKLVSPPILFLSIISYPQDR